VRILPLTRKANGDELHKYGDEVGHAVMVFLTVG
jgi:hypothetical protein